MLAAVLALAAVTEVKAASETNASAQSGWTLPSFNWNPPTLKDWWNGNSGTANWFGLGYPLKDNGLTIVGALKYVYFGQVSGGFPASSGQPTSNFIPEVKLRFIYDFAKLFGIDGLTVTSYWRYRGVAGNNPAYAAGTTGITGGWNPTDMSSGFGVRMMEQKLQYTTKNGVLTIDGGLENPYDYFLQQPLSKLFENNMVNSHKGIGVTAGPGLAVNTQKGEKQYSASPVGWSSSYLAWGGTLKVKPIKDVYIQSGLYEAVAGDTGINQSMFTATSVYPYTYVPQSYMGTFKHSGQVVANTQPNGTVSGTKNIGTQPNYQNNHGFTTGGAPNNNYTGGAGGSYTAWSGNGLFNVNELGWTPKLGADKLDGKYAIGCYIWGLPNTSYTPNAYNSGMKKVLGSVYNSCSAGLYLQGDQMLFRHHDGPASSSLSDRGLYSFNEMNVTSPFYNAMPFYFQTGLVYKGLMDLRPRDSIGAVVGSGFYSAQLNSYQTSLNAHNGGYAPLPTYTSTQVIEGFYNIEINKWASFKPYAQCLVNPAGNGTLGTVWTLGARLAVSF